MRDVLTNEECDALWRSDLAINTMLQRAARLGAEREKERAATVCEEFAQDIGEPRIEKLLDDCAAAIRRGEEG